MKKLLAIAVAALLATGAAHASTVTLDYSGAPASFSSFEEDGFRTSVDIGALQNGFFRPGEAYVATLAGSLTTIERVGGGAFSALSIDLVQWSPTPVTAIILGQRSGGGIVSQAIANITTLATYNLSSDFSNIVALGLTQGAYSGALGAVGFDNVNLAPVPLPAGVLLLLTAMGGMFVLRRSGTA
jgi:hypothetical protein